MIRKLASELLVLVETRCAKPKLCAHIIARLRAVKAGLVKQTCGMQQACEITVSHPKARLHIGTNRTWRNASIHSMLKEARGITH